MADLEGASPSTAMPCRHRRRHLHTKEAALPEPTGSLFDPVPGTITAPGRFPQSQGERSYGMADLDAATSELDERLFRGTPGQPVPWASMVLTRLSDQTAETRVIDSLHAAFEEVRVFIVDASARLEDVRQAQLTYTQKPHHEALSFLTSADDTGGMEMFADLALATLLDLASALTPPWSPNGTIPPTNDDGGIAPLNGEGLTWALAHYLDWFERLHQTAVRSDLTDRHLLQPVLNADR